MRKINRISHGNYNNVSFVRDLKSFCGGNTTKNRVKVNDLPCWTYLRSAENKEHMKYLVGIYFLF